MFHLQTCVPIPISSICTSSNFHFVDFLEVEEFPEYLKKVRREEEQLEEEEKRKEQRKKETSTVSMCTYVDV